MHATAERSRARLAAALAAAAAAAACSGGDPFGGVVWSSAHFEYHARPDDPNACPEALDRLEAEGELLVDTFAIDRARWGTTVYHKYGDAADLHASGPCSASAAACADAHTIDSVVPVDGHELVHAIVGKEVGTDVNLLLAEGMANAISCAPTWQLVRADWNWRDFGVSPPLSNPFNHGQAGAFVLGLLLSVPPPTLVDMLGAIPGGATPDQFASLLGSRWGVDPDAVWSAAVARNLPPCMPAYACAGPELAEGTTALAVGCGGATPAVLPRRAGAVKLHASGDDVLLMTCSPRATSLALHQLKLTRSAAGFDFWLRLPADDHALWQAQAESGKAASTSVDLTTLTGAFAPACDDSRADALAPGHTAAVVLTGGQPAAYFPLALDQARQVSVGWDLLAAPLDPVDVAWCTGCAAGAATGCTPLDLSGGAQIVTSPAHAVLFVSPSAAFTDRAVLTVTPM